MGVVIIASDASAVGKSVVAALIGRHRPGVRASVGAPAPERRSGFGALVAGVHECGGGLQKSPLWDEVIEVISGGAATICIDTGSTNTFFEWCAKSRVDEIVGDINATLVIPVTRGALAMRAAVEAIGRARFYEGSRGLSFSKIVVVMNERDGDPAELPEGRDLAWRAGGGGQIRLGKAPPMLAALENAGLKLDVLDPFVGKRGAGGEVGALFGWDKFQGGHELFRYSDWLAASDENLRLGGLLD